jgi:surface carbohydrate biosynthesis protein (TIGR04326 family)
MYEDSVFGTHAVRTALLTEMFHSQVRRRSPRTLWVIAFEGQGWESCLARALQAEARPWVPYLHTMMRPWDLRARTFLREISPEIVAVHGEHDASELGSLGVPLVTVEALRYAHLGNAQVAYRSAKEGLATPVRTPVGLSMTWLAVGGAECERSNLELRALLDSLHEAGVSRDIVVRWHPQCGQPMIPLGDQARVSSAALVDLQNDARVAILLGSAAPLDTYLQGIPTCAFVAPSGYDMSPVEQDARFQVFRLGSDLVRWALEME